MDGSPAATEANSSPLRLPARDIITQQRNKCLHEHVPCSVQPYPVAMRVSDLVAVYTILPTV